MFSYKYTEDTFRRFYFEHAKDAGKFCAECMIQWPELYKQFMEGFYDELRRQCRTDRGDSAEGPPQDEAK